jgi:hypothetical protein
LKPGEMHRHVNALEATGGKTYAELDTEDPPRTTAMQASFLRAGRSRCRQLKDLITSTTPPGYPAVVSPKIQSNDSRLGSVPSVTSKFLEVIRAGRSMRIPDWHEGCYYC